MLSPNIIRFLAISIALPANLPFFPSVTNAAGLPKDEVDVRDIFADVPQALTPIMRMLAKRRFMGELFIWYLSGDGVECRSIWFAVTLGKI